MNQSASDLTDWADVHGDQILGQRESQQDRFDSAWLPGTSDSKHARLLLVLADGMGGHQAGDIASEEAIKAFMLAAQENARKDSESILFLGLSAAGSAVFERAAAQPHLAGMGTTLIGVIVEKIPGGMQYHMVSVGDSPLWFWCKSDDRLERANADHSLAGELARDVASGKLTQAQAEVDPRREMGNVLTSAITADAENEYEIDSTQNGGPRELSVGDLLILSSDGLDTLPPSKLSEQLAAACKDGRFAARIVEDLLTSVTETGDPYQDNASVLTARLDKPPMPRRRKILGLF